jgi:hypothetical protein
MLEPDELIRTQERYFDRAGTCADHIDGYASYLHSENQTAKLRKHMFF